MINKNRYYAIHNSTRFPKDEGSLDFMIEEDIKNYCTADSISMLGVVKTKMNTLERIMPQMLILMGYNPVQGNVRLRRKSTLGIIEPDEIRYQRIDPAVDEDWKNSVLTIGPISYEKSIELLEVMAKNSFNIKKLS